MNACSARAEFAKAMSVSFRLGWDSVRANAVPMVVLWAVAAVLVFGYYLVPGVAGFLQPVAEWQVAWGVWAAIANQLFFSVAIPTAFVLTVARIKTERPFAKMACQALWASFSAIVYVWFYGFQCRMFGVGHGLATVLAKAAFDQFIWTPFVMVPLSSVFFLWLGSGFSFPATFAACRGQFVRRVVLPNLLSNWCVWIPVMFAIYAFPRDLQVQVLGFVGSFWTLLQLQIGKRISDER